jgi:hypothetical protein
MKIPSHTVKFVWKKKQFIVDARAYTDYNSLIKLPDGTTLAFNGWKTNDDGLPEPVSARIVTILDADEVQPVDTEGLTA